MPSPPAVSDYALVVLGCRLVPGVREPLGEGTARRRVAAGARAWHERTRDRDGAEGPSVVIASGGRVWDGRREADAMGAALEEMGVPAARIVRERLSFTTRENARFVAAACAKRGIGRVALVTCGWHLARAARCFEAEGLVVVARISAGEGSHGWARRAWIRGKERALAALVRAR